MTIRSWLKRQLVGRPPTQYEVRLSAPEFLADATIEEINAPEHSHVLELEFDRPAGDENRAAELYVKDARMNQGWRGSLYPGDEGISFRCSPPYGTFEVIFADRDGVIVANDEVTVTAVEP